MKKLKKMTAVLLAATMTISVTAATAASAAAVTTDSASAVSSGSTVWGTNGVYSYNINDNSTIEILTCNKTSGDIVIPSAINGKTVVSIAANAFKLNKDDSYVTIPATVTTIDRDAFSGSTRLLMFRVDSANPSFSADSDGVLFNKDKSVLIEYPQGSLLSSYQIPNGVKTVSENAFYECQYLSSVVVPDSVEKIGISAFSGSPSLKQAKLGSGITEIPTSMFNKCTALTSVSVSEGVTKIGVNAFAYCSALKEIILPKTVTNISDSALYEVSPDYLCVPEGSYAKGYSIDRGLPYMSYTTNDTTLFGDESQMAIVEYVGTAKEITIPSEINSVPVARICKSAFKENQELEAVVIPDSVHAIEAYAFKNCYALDNVVVPNSVKQIDRDAFDRTAFISRIIDDYIVLGDGVLYEYQGRDANVSIPSSIKAIGGGAFEDIITLTGVSIPKSVEYIFDYAFYNCLNLQNVKLTGNIKHMGYMIFANCYSLQSVYYPNGIGTISSKQFDNCSRLSYIVVGESVKFDSEIASSCSLFKTVYGISGSPAEEFANAYGYNFVSVMKGDLDSNGKITVADAVLIQKHIANINTLSDIQLLAGDIDKNDNITVADAVLIQKHIANISQIG